MFSEFRRWVSTIVILLALLGLFHYFSMSNEAQHLANCEKLGITCENPEYVQTSSKWFRWTQEKTKKYSQAVRDLLGWGKHPDEPKPEAPKK